MEETTTADALTEALRAKYAAQNRDEHDPTVSLSERKILRRREKANEAF